MAEELGKASAAAGELTNVMGKKQGRPPIILPAPLSFEPSASWKIRDEVTELDGSTWFKIHTTIFGPRHTFCSDDDSDFDISEHSVQFEAMLEKDQGISSLTIDLAIKMQGLEGPMTSTSNVTLNANGGWETINSPDFSLFLGDAEAVVSYSGSQEVKGLSFKRTVWVS